METISSNKTRLPYTIKNETGIVLGKEKTPECSRFPSCEYNEPGADSPALAYLDNQGELHLYHVAEEVPKTDWITITENVTDDGTNLMKTQREILVLEAKEAQAPTLIVATEPGCQ